MTALLDNISVLHDQDNVRLLDGGKPVGYDKAGPSLHHGGKGILDLQFRAGIYG